MSTKRQAMHKSREDWLLHAVEIARPMFEDVGAPLPDNVRVAVGRTSRKTYLGECYGDKHSEDGGREIWIKPYTTQPLELVSTLIHELCHAALPYGVKHKKPFIDLARKMHLEGPPTKASGGGKFCEIWEPLVKQLGEYPGKVFFDKVGSSTQGTVQKAHLKLCCSKCDINFWITPKFVKKLTAMQCIDASNCGGELYVE
jgi:hypothetical protein